MLVDSTLVLSDAQAISLVDSNVISTNVIDLTTLVAAQQLGFVWVNAVVGTALTGSSTPTIQVALMQDSDEAVGNGVEVLKSRAFGVSASTAAAAGTVLMSVQIPLDRLDRYVGMEYTVVNTINAGTIDAFFSLEPLNESLNIQAAMPTPSPS